MIIVYNSKKETDTYQQFNVNIFIVDSIVSTDGPSIVTNSTN